MLWPVLALPIPDPATRHSLTLQTFTNECLPPFLCYYLTALLVIRPRTFPIRLPLLPLTLYVTGRCATQVDVAKGHPEYDRLVLFNVVLMMCMTTIATHASIWTFRFEPYRRLKHSTGNSFLDALDLCCNIRGLGWCWSTGLKVPKETRNTSSTTAFLLSTFRSCVVHFLLSDFTFFALQSFELSKPTGIFSPTLTPFPRYTRSTLISLLLAIAVYSTLLTSYQLLTLFAVCFPITALRNTPEQWPPLFDRPWISTSVNDLCARRWHQLSRHQCVYFGGSPSNYLLGRLGGVIGVFLVSGVIHYIWLWGVGRGTDFGSIVGAFFMVGVGTVAEYVFNRVTGRKVGGVRGWAWTVFWVFCWCPPFVNALLTRGAGEFALVPNRLRPSVALAELL